MATDAGSGSGAADLHGRPAPCNCERVSALYHWRFPGLIAAPPRLHGLGSAFSFRGSAAAIVRPGWAAVNGEIKKPLGVDVRG